MAHAPNHTDVAEWLIVLTPHERRVIRIALKKYRYACEKRIAQNARKGWKPAEGKIDLNPASIETIDGLIVRIPFPTFAGGSGERG